MDQLCSGTYSTGLMFDQFSSARFLSQMSHCNNINVLEPFSVDESNLCCSRGQMCAKYDIKKMKPQHAVHSPAPPDL